MIPYLLAIDDVLPTGEFELLRAYCQNQIYKDRVGPDGSRYAGICDKVPACIKEDLTHVFTWVMGQRVELKICAFRLSVDETTPPQWAHSDAQVSRWASFLYINPGPGGTVLLQHKVTGMTRHPESQLEMDVLHRDQNNRDAWEIVGGVDCKPNRAVILPSERIHAATPMYGFGSGPSDGRLILWTFFD